MNTFFRSLTLVNPVSFLILVVLGAGRIALGVFLRKSILEDKTIRIISLAASIFVGLAALLLFMLMAQNTSRLM